MRKKFGKIVLLITTFLFTALEFMAQCPMCKAGVESHEGGAAENHLAEGLNVGILYLFVLPYAAIALVAFLWYRKYRKKKKAEAARGELAFDVE